MSRPKTKTDAEVLAATGRAVLRRGPHDFTLADVAGEVGLSPATLLQRFGTKRGLLVAFARHSAAHAEAPFAQAAKAGGTPLAVLRRALLLLAADAQGRRELANSMALLVEDVRDAALRREAARHATQTEREVERLLRAAVRLGELQSEDPAALARTVYAAWNGGLIQWGLRGKGNVAAWLDAVLDPLLTGPR